MRLLPLIIAAAVLAPPVLADVLPPREEISDVQAALVGEWRQSGPSHMRGHGEGRTILVFGKSDYVMVQFNAIEPSNVYDAHATEGGWTARDMGGGTYEVTMTPGGMAAPDETEASEVHTIRITSPTTFDFEKFHGRPESVAPFTKLSD